MSIPCKQCMIPSLLYVVKDDSSDLIIDNRTKKVIRDGKEIPLTQKEFQLLSLFYSDRGKVFSKMEILQSVWGDGWYIIFFDKKNIDKDGKI